MTTSCCDWTGVALPAGQVAISNRIAGGFDGLSPGCQVVAAPNGKVE